MSTRTWRILFWAASLFALVMALMPHPPRLPGDPDDKVQHIIAFVMLGLLARVAYRHQRIVVLLMGLSLFGALIEVLQTIPALHRDGDPIDWVADTAAAGLALLGFRLFEHRWTHGQ